MKTITQFLNETNSDIDPFGEENWGSEKKYKVFKIEYQKTRLDSVAIVEAENEEHAIEKAQYDLNTDWDYYDTDILETEIEEITARLDE